MENNAAKFNNYENLINLIEKSLQAVAGITLPRKVWCYINRSKTGQIFKIKSRQLKS